MKASLFGAIAALLVTAAGVAQAADNYLVQLDDTLPGGQVAGNTYKNGTLIQSVVFSGDAIISSYGLWSGATLNASFDNQFNYYDLDGVTLSDTVEVSGTAGDSFFYIDFRSASALAGALPNGGAYIEDGSFQQAVYPGTVSNGDYYNIQMASEADAGGVPEPATWSLMLLGVAGLGGALRSRRNAAAAAA